jgi:hypothetical protein
MFGMLPGRVTYVTDREGKNNNDFDSMMALSIFQKRWKR